MFVIKYSSVCAVIFLSVFLLLQATAEDVKRSMPSKKRKISDELPYLHSEAEKWSFKNQIQNSIPDLLERVEKNAKELMKTRYSFGRAVKIPEYHAKLRPEASSRERINGTVHLIEGLANGFLNISLVGESKATYEGSTIKIHSDLNVWKHLVFVCQYKIIENCHEFKGRIKKDIHDVNYSLVIAIDIPTKNMKLQEFRRKSIGKPLGTRPPSSSAESSSESVQECGQVTVGSSSGRGCNTAGDTQVDGLKGKNQLRNKLVSIFSQFSQDSVFLDIETVMKTILEDSVRNISVINFLPEADYTIEGPRSPLVGADTLEICDTDVVETDEIEEDEGLWMSVTDIPKSVTKVPWKSVTEIPFILNIGEMWAFQNQMNSGLRQLMERISTRTTENLTKRELLRAKLADDKFLMNIKDRTSTMRHSPMVLSAGTFSSPFKFNVSPVREVEFQDKNMIFTSSFHLEDPIEFDYNFTATFLRENYKGEVSGSVKFVEYALKFSLDLETAVLTLEDPKLDCARDITIVVTGMNLDDEWFSSELKRNMLQRFGDAIMPQIHIVLSQSLYYVVSTENAMQYMPKWNYARDFRTDFGLRIGENDEDTVEICNTERMKKLEERSQRFSKLISRDGAFSDLVHGADGKFFTHVSGIKNTPIRYISTKTQSWYFDQEMRLKMNEYMYKLLKMTREIIETRNLGKLGIPDYEEEEANKFKIKMKKCWVDGLTSVTVTGVDILEYDQKTISLWTNILVYKDLKFKGMFSMRRPNGSTLKMIGDSQLPPMELALRIDIDYLGEKKAKLEYMKLECVGANASYPYSSEEHISDAFDTFFRGIMVEHIVQIFRHAFEDALIETKWEEFLPKWDYERDYITEIILHQNMNRFQLYMDFCNGTENHKPSLKDLYPDLETLDFSHFLPEIKIPGLRRSFERQIKILMNDAVNSMWRNMVKNPLKHFSPLKFWDKGLSLKSKDSGEIRVSLIYSVIDFQGLNSSIFLDDVDFAYGKENTLIMLYQQSFDSLKAIYNLTLTDSQEGWAENGTAVATAEGLQYLLKVRFFLNNSTFSIDEFFLRCLQNFSVTVQGLSPEREVYLDSVKNSMLLSFPESELPEIKELLYILYGYAATELKIVLYTYSWTYDRELFQIATQEEVPREAKPKACKEEANRGNSTIIARKNISFIGSEAELGSFSSQMKVQIDRYKKEVRKVAREFIRSHALESPLISDLSKDFSRETNQENETVICRLMEGIAGNLLHVKYVGDILVDAGKDMKITAFVTFDENLKLRYRLEAKSGKKSIYGRVRTTPKSLVYKMVISVDKKNRSANLESFDLECMSDMEVFIRIAEKKVVWLKDLIPGAFESDFMAVVIGDIRKMLKMAFKFGVKNAEVTPFVENWNYEKEYGERSIREYQVEEDFSMCQA